MTKWATAILLTFFAAISCCAHAEGHTIGVSWGNLDSAQTRGTEKALSARFLALGDRYIFEDAGGSSAKQAEDIARLLEAGAQVLIIDAVDTDAVRTSIDLAKRYKIPVIAYQKIIDDPEVLNIAPDYKKIGMLQAKAVVAQKPEGNYVFAGGAVNDLNSSLVREGQMQTLAGELASGKVKNVAEFSASDIGADDAERNMEKALNANGNRIDAVLAVDDQTAEGAIAALRQKDLAGSVPVSGSGGTLAAIGRVALGTQTVTFWQNPDSLAQEMAQAANLLASGKSRNISGVRKEINPVTGREYSGIFLDPEEVTKYNMAIIGDTCANEVPGSSPACPADAGPHPAGPPVRTVPIYFGTDRADLQGSSPLDFGSDRSNHLTVGVAHVSIPDDHRFGVIERPSETKLIWIRLTRGSVDPHKFFTVQGTKVLSEVEFAKEASAAVKSGTRFGKRAFVFVHGFNVTFDDALYSVAQIVWDMQFDGLACLYSWPSKGAVSLSDYNYDNNSALQARDELAEFLDLVQGVDGVESIDIVAHSMGSVALMEALRKHSQEPNAKPFNELIFAAPDIDKDNFVSLAKGLSSYSSGITLYASSNDSALKISESLASKVARAGEVPAGGPIVVPDIDTIDASAVSNYLFSFNHSYFAQDRSVVSDIGMLFERGIRPPTVRNPTIRAVTNKAGQTYWQFPQ